MSDILIGVINEGLHKTAGGSDKNTSIQKQVNDAISKNDNSESNRKEELSRYNYGKARSNGMIVTDQQHERKSQECGTDKGLKGIRNVDDYKKEIEKRKLENHPPRTQETSRAQRQGKDTIGLQEAKGNTVESISSPNGAPKAVMDYKKAIAAKSSSKKGHYEQKQRTNSLNKRKASNVKYDRKVVNFPTPKCGSGRSR